MGDIEIKDVSHVSIGVSDMPRSIAFYRDVFGWETHTASDSDELRYTTLGEGESMQAGIMDATTGRRLVVGTKNTSFRGTLVRTPAGWRVQTGELLQGATCTPAA